MGPQGTFSASFREQIFMYHFKLIIGIILVVGKKTVNKKKSLPSTLREKK